MVLGLYIFLYTFLKSVKPSNHFRMGNMSRKLKLDLVFKGYDSWPLEGDKVFYKWSQEIISDCG